MISSNLRHNERVTRVAFEEWLPMLAHQLARLRHSFFPVQDEADLGRCARTPPHSCLQGYNVGVFVEGGIIEEMNDGALFLVMFVCHDAEH